MHKLMQAGTCLDTQHNNSHTLSHKNVTHRRRPQLRFHYQGKKKDSHMLTHTPLPSSTPAELYTQPKDPPASLACDCELCTNIPHRDTAYTRAHTCLAIDSHNTPYSGRMPHTHTHTHSMCCCIVQHTHAHTCTHHVMVSKRPPAHAWHMQVQ